MGARKSNLPADVELQFTSMLDMSFQLLAFFIMTYNPMPVEGQFAMNILPSTPQTNAESVQTDQPNPDVPAELRTLRITVGTAAGGTIGRVSVGDREVEGMPQLRTLLEQILSDKSLPFDQAMIIADRELHYAELIRVVDVLMGLEITKISFSELAEGEGGPAI